MTAFRRDPTVRRSNSSNAVIDGDVKNGTVMAGQIAGLIKKEQSCKEIVDEIMEQAEKLLHH